MSWIADFDAGSREMPTLVHVTRVTSGGFLQGETYVPIIDTHKIRNENAKLRELVCMMLRVAGVAEHATDSEWQTITDYLGELGIEVG